MLLMRNLLPRMIESPKIGHYDYYINFLIDLQQNTFPSQFPNHEILSDGWAKQRFFLEKESRNLFCWVV